MPLLMCPNDNASMQTVKRDGIEFDMCPTCRGVWLDRGELEKLMEDARAAASSQPRQPTERDGQGRHQHEGTHAKRGDHDGRSHKRRGGFDLFDIFD